jgi:proteic killer suppression protein
LKVIVSFANANSERVWQRQRVTKFSLEIQRAAYKRMLILDAADFLIDLRRPPGNRLEALQGDRAGQHSIRINDQWRLCFNWTSNGPENVEIADYH